MKSEIKILQEKIRNLKKKKKKILQEKIRKLKKKKKKLFCVMVFLI